MPEGPEIETVYRQLNPLLLNQTIIYANSYSNSFPIPHTGKVVQFWRHGKWLHLLFADNTLMRINFGMSGRIALGKIKDKHKKWKIKTKNQIISYIDPRGFGHLEIIKKAANKTKFTVGTNYFNLGPDIMSPFMTQEPNTGLIDCWINILKSSRPLKVVLMDQSKVAGIGNIYANELCYLIHIHPETPANKLNRQDICRLINKSRVLFKAAVLARGTSFGDVNTYRSIKGKEGNYSRFLKAYNQEGERCICSGTIVKYHLRGRSTFICTKCQRKKNEHKPKTTTRTAIKAGRIKSRNSQQRISQSKASAYRSN